MFQVLENVVWVKVREKHPTAHKYIIRKEKTVLIAFSFNCRFPSLILLSASSRFLKSSSYMKTEIT